MGAVTNVNGEYEIRSIRPAKYPNSNAPAHIHAAVKTPANDIYWISDFVFKDDPAIGKNYRSNNPGGTGVVDMQLVNGTWTGTRDITLSR
jgi:protocatechuate 3,4-dioxygenase beta subunit